MTIYHGTSAAKLKPCFGYGRNYHDYGNGFYTTEDKEAAKEWACQGVNELAFVYTYELDTSGLEMLVIDENDILAWVSVLMTHRRSKKVRGAALERCSRMIERFGIDVGKYDVIRGYRANDSYFQFTTDFVTDTITLETLSNSIITGNLGYQVCVKSEAAYRSLVNTEVLSISGDEYKEYNRCHFKKDRDMRNIADNYSNEPQIGKLLSDILREGVS